MIEALYGAAHAFFRPAYTGPRPADGARRTLVQEAKAVNFLSHNVASFAGPALAALLVVTVGAGAAFVIDAATFFVSALLLLRVRPRERGERAGAPAGAGRAGRRLARGARPAVGRPDHRLARRWR